MNLKLSKHVFGSIKGYKTLARSADVTDEESSHLEHFSFGQTNNKEYLDSLKSSPAFISRPLPSGRRAITRVFKGPLDDYKRHTLLFVSVILNENDWTNVLFCDVKPLLASKDIWRFESGKLISDTLDVQPVRPKTSDSLRKQVIPMLAATEKILHSGKNVILVDYENYGLKVFRLLNMLLPKETSKTFSLAVRSLSSSLDVDVIAMDSAGSMGKPFRKAIRFSPVEPDESTPYTSMINSLWQKNGVPPWQFIAKCPSFAGPANQIDQVKPDPIEKERQPYFQEQAKNASRKVAPLIVKISMTMLAVTVIAVAGMIAFKISEKKKNIQEMLVKTNAFITGNNDIYANITSFDSFKSEFEQLRMSVNTLLATSNDPCLISDLEVIENLYDQTSNKKEIHKLITDFISACKKNLPKLPVKTYPEHDQINKALDYQKQCHEYLNQEDIQKLPGRLDQQLNPFVTALDKWNNELANPLLQLDKEHSKRDEQIFKTINEIPDIYRDSYIDKLKEARKPLDVTLENDSLYNALKSPVNEHSVLSQMIKEKISRTKKRIDDKIKLIERAKERSNEICLDIQRIYDSNDFQVPDLFDRNTLKEFFSYDKKLVIARELYPDNKNLNKCKNAILNTFDKNVIQINQPDFDKKKRLDITAYLKKQLKKLDSNKDLKESVESAIEKFQRYGTE